MSAGVWPSSPLAAAERAFQLVVSAPSALALDGSAVAGLPDAMVPLDEVRRRLLGPQASAQLQDTVWRLIVDRARGEGASWMVGAVGVALPGLRRAAGRLARGWRGDHDDVDAELLAGFLARLATVDAGRPRVCGRLIDAGLRAARKARDAQAQSHEQMIMPVVGPANPAPLSWDHPDFVLGRAVQAGVIDTEEAFLIGATRLEEQPVARAAEHLGVRAEVAAAWRRRAEHRLAASIRAGELSPAW